MQLKAYEKQRRQIEKDEAYIRKNKAGTRSTMAKSRQKRLDKLERIDPPSDNLQAHFKFPYIELLSASTLTVSGLSVGYETPLLSPVTFSMSHGQKVVLKGFNGVGKSTLIKSILGIIPSFPDPFTLSIPASSIISIRISNGTIRRKHRSKRCRIFIRNLSRKRSGSALPVPE